MVLPDTEVVEHVDDVAGSVADPDPVGNRTFLVGSGSDQLSGSRSDHNKLYGRYFLKNLHF